MDQLALSRMILGIVKLHSQPFEQLSVPAPLPDLHALALLLEILLVWSLVLWQHRFHHDDVASVLDALLHTGKCVLQVVALQIA